MLVPNAVAEYINRIRSIREDPGHNKETSLYGPLEWLLSETLRGSRIVPQHNTRQCGVPDYALLDSHGQPFAYVEAKAYDKRLQGLRDVEKAQRDRYAELPCVLYTNFWELRLWVEGAEVTSARLCEEDALDPEFRSPPPALDLGAANSLLERFSSFEPAPLRSPKEIARGLARRARLVRSVVAEAVAEGESDPLNELYREFDRILYAELSPDRFADAYAQTLTYGLLLARILDPNEALSPQSPPRALGEEHRLLSAAMRLLGQQEPKERIGWSLDALVATVQRVDPAVLRRKDEHDPALYFYEDFLEEYDPVLRRQTGSYYTPQEIVAFQVRAVEELLANDLGENDGLSSPAVTVLDPATGTGTYLLGALRAVEARAQKEQGGAAVRGAIDALAHRAYGFEIQVGPYAVARWRLATFLAEHGVTHPPSVLLTDTLSQAESGRQVPGRFGFMAKPLSDERAEADRVKARQPIMVILGNPPYQRTNLPAMGVDVEGETGPSLWLWRKVEEFKEGVPENERVKAFEVSGYRVIERWLEARRDLTLVPEEVKELLTVAWAVRRTIELGDQLDSLLQKLIDAPKLELPA